MSENKSHPEPHEVDFKAGESTEVEDGSPSLGSSIPIPSEKPEKITNFAILMTVFGAVMYCIDILQDIWVAAASLRSSVLHKVSTTLQIQENVFGFVMVGIFVVSVIVVGVEAMKKMNGLNVVKKHPRLQFIVVPLCLLNLGPVSMMMMKLIVQTEQAQKFYDSKEEQKQDQQLLEQALSATKFKEGVCENLPMLVIVTFKIS